MDNRPPGPRLTFLEILVALGVILVLAAMALPAITAGPVRSSLTQMLSAMKQLHLATQQMALDGSTTGDATLGWPGTNSFHTWATNLVPAYLSSNDFARLLRAPQDHEAGPIRRTLVQWREGEPGHPEANTNAILVYQVSESSEGNAVFLSSANFVATPPRGTFNSNAPALRGRIYAARGFVVFRKGGDGAVLLPRQATNAELVGACGELLR